MRAPHPFPLPIGWGEGVRRTGEGIHHAQDVLVGERVRVAVVHEVALGGDAEVADGNFEFMGRQQLRHLLARPAIEFAFLAFAVGVFSGIESAFRMRHIAQHVADDVARDVGKPRVATGQIGVEIEVHQLRVVIEHFFEMRHEPLSIDRVTMEAAADLVMQTARGHPLTGVQHHADRLVILESRAVVEQKRRFARAWKFWRAGEPPVFRIVFVLELSRGVVQQSWREHQGVGGFASRVVFQLPVQAGGGVEQVAVPCFP